MKKVLFLFLLFTITYSVFAETDYTSIVDLGYNRLATELNTSGLIVGRTGDSNNKSSALIFDASGNGSELDISSDLSFRSGALDVNQLGDIVGYEWFSDGNSDEDYCKSTLFSMSGNLGLGTLGGSSSWARSISDNGTIVGHSYNTNGEMRATLFDSTGNGNNIDLGALSGFRFSEAFSINKNEWVVGTSFTSPSSYRESATLFDITGNNNHIDLGPKDGRNSRANSISNNGLIVGSIEGINSPVIFDSSGSGDYLELGNLEDFNKSYAEISESGIIYGYSQKFDLELRQFIDCATLFDSTGNGDHINLNDLIDINSGWYLETISAVSEDGWIIGTGINPDGLSSAYLITPEPATLFLLALGGLVLRKRKP